MAGSTTSTVSVVEAGKPAKDPAAAQKRKAALGRIYAFSKPEAIRLTFGFTSLIVNSVTNLSFPWLMGRSLDQVTVDNYGNFLVGAGALLAAGSLASWVRVYCMGTATDNIAARLRRELFESYLDKDLEYFDSAKSGELISLLDADVNEASEVFTEKLSAALRSLNSALNGSILLYLTSPRLTCVALSVVPVVGVGAMTLSRFSTALTKQLRSLQSDMLSYSLERVSNIATVKLNSREQYEKERYGAYITTSNEVSRKRFNARGQFMAFINLSTNASLLAVLREGGRMMADGIITAGGLTRFAIQSAFVGLGFSGLATVYSDFNAALDAAARVFEIIDQNKEERSKRALLALTNDSTVDKSSLAKLNAAAHEIQLENLSFSYASRPTTAVLSHLNLTLKPRSITCIVGKSGAGKSTLVGVLGGLLQPTSGCVLVGGEVVVATRENDTQIARQSWLRAQVGVVQQHDKSLMSGTIRDNIEYGKAGASQAEIEAAAKAANAHDFIVALPDGYNSEVGTGGSLLSGGQRARVALARALVKDPAVLLLDEPTAALDSDSEQSVISALSSLRKSKTIIVITHSNAVKEVADKVYEMQDGAIVA
eukprot:gene14020-16120_t